MVQCIYYVKITLGYGNLMPARAEIIPNLRIKNLKNFSISLGAYLPFHNLDKIIQQLLKSFFAKHNFVTLLFSEIT